MECINWKNVIIGAVFGAAAGGVSAVPGLGGVSETATAVEIHQATVRTMLVGAVSNSAQYEVSRRFNGEAFDPASLLVSFLGGFVAGRISGPTTYPDTGTMKLIGSYRPILVDMAWDNLPRSTAGDTMRSMVAVPPAYLPGYSPPACTCN